MLANWDLELPRFWQVCPKEMLTRLAHPIEAAAAIAAE
jgi:glutamate synthase (NADPH/NADH) large chain